VLVWFLLAFSKKFQLDCLLSPNGNVRRVIHFKSANIGPKRLAERRFGGGPQQR
jgi:hypothetical protein